jgi:hypothetical protein
VVDGETAKRWENEGGEGGKCQASSNEVME